MSESEEREKLSVLKLFPGSLSREERRLNERLEGFSDFSCGSVVSLSDIGDTYYVGNYKVVLVKAGRRYGFVANLRLLMATVREALHLKRNRGLDLIVSYDALKIGLFGIVVKFFTGAKLIVEVNSEFNSPELYKFKTGFWVTIKKYMYPAIKKFVLRFADGIKGLYPGQLDEINIKGSKKVNYFFDHTSISSAVFQENDDKLILTLGFPSYIKGVDVLIKAFNGVSDEFKNWKLEIIGHFKPSEIDDMRSLSEGDERVTISRPIEFSEIPEKIDSCSIFVLASRTEGIPRVLIEAMARSKARIASEVGGIPAVIEDGVDGLIFEKGNSEELRKKLELLMSDKGERQRMAKNANRRFNKEFTFEVYKEKIKKFYYFVFLEGLDE